MSLHHSPRIVTDNMVLCLDVANKKSYDYKENRYPYSEQLERLGFTRSSYTKYSSGGPYNNSYVEITVTDSTAPYQWDSLNTITIPAGTIAVFSAVVKNVSLSYNKIYLRCWSGTGRAFTSVAHQIAFDFTTKQTSVSSGTILSHGFIDEKNGWYRIWFTAQAEATGYSAVSLYQTAANGSVYRLSALQVAFNPELSDYAPTNGTAIIPSTVYDLSGTGNTGTLVNNPIYNKSGYLTFTQTATTAINYANNSSYYFLNREAYTLEFLIMANTLPAYNTWRRILHRESNPGTGRDGYNFWVDGRANGTDIAFYHERFVAGVNISVGISLPYATTGSSWNHWVITYNGSELRMYRNGTLVSGPVADTRNITNNTAPLYIASQGGATASGIDIANAKIYSTALSEDQVKQNFNAIRGRFGL